MPRRNEGRIKVLPVEYCENWKTVIAYEGAHCFNCQNRYGFPYRAQPDINCKNFKKLEVRKDA